MKLIDTTITKNLIASTENANYQIEYAVTNSSLTKVTVNISNINPSQYNETYIGYINFENENITSNFNSTYLVTKYFSDFETFMKEILEIEAKQE